MDNLAAANFGQFKISVVVTRENVTQLDAFADIADGYGAQLRLTRFRPSGRGVDTWDDLHPTAEQQRTLYHWLLERPDVLTGDSFFHLSALGEPLDGLNLCGAGRVVCLIDPVGDVYACPFVIDASSWPATCATRAASPAVWRESELFRSLREPQSAGACASCGSYDACQGGCMAAKFFTGLPARRPRPRVRLRSRGGGAGRSRRSVPAAARSGTPRCDRTARRSRCRRQCTSGHRHAWPDVAVRAGRRHLARVEASAAATSLLVLPVGSLEQHGPHLPFDTDTRIASGVAHRLAAVSSGRGGGARPRPTVPAASTPASPARCWSITRCWPGS